MTTDQLIIEACSLPLEQRAHVADCLLQSLTETNVENDRAWLELAHSRQAEMRAGQIQGIPAEEAFQQTFAKYV